jgi:hypothetical protein
VIGVPRFDVSFVACADGLSLGIEEDRTAAAAMGFIDESKGPYRFSRIPIQYIIAASARISAGSGAAQGSVSHVRRLFVFTVARAGFGYERWTT